MKRVAVAGAKKAVATTTGGQYGALGLLHGADATAAAATVKAHHKDTVTMKRINDAAASASAASHAMNSTMPTAESKAAEEEAAYAALGAEPSGGGADTTLGAGSTTLNHQSSTGGGSSSASSSASSSSSSSDAAPPPANIRYVNYVKLCRDLEPTDGSGRDSDDLARRLNEEWQQKAPEKSTIYRLLETEVGEYRKELADEAEAKRLAMVGIGVENGGGKAVSHLASNRGEDEDLSSTALNPWEVHALFRFVTKADADGSGFLDRSELTACLENMALLGRKFSMVAGDEQGEEKDSAGGASADDPASVADAKTKLYDRIFSAFDEDGDGKIAWKEFLKGVVQGISDDETGIVIMPPLTWEPLEPHIAAEKASELFAEVN